MAIVSIGGTSGKPGTNLAVTVGAGGVPAGVLIVVVISCNGNATGPGTTTDSAGNTYHDAGDATGQSPIVTIGVQYAFNASALTNGQTITTSYTSQTYAVSAFYWDGAQTSSDPLVSAAGVTATGTSTTPSVTLNATPPANSLCVGGLALDATTSDTITQPGGFATPPNVFGTSGGTANTNSTAGGGTRIVSTAATYNPTLANSHGWALVGVAFRPPSTAVPWGWEVVGTQNPYVKMPAAVGGSPT